MLIIKLLRGFINYSKRLWFSIFRFFFLRDKLITGKSFRINGLPQISCDNNGKIVIGKKVRLNSRNRNYHLNMFGPVKLMADRPGARIEIGDHTRIHGSCIHAYKKISIGKNCLIAANCQIFDGNGHDLSMDDVYNRVNTIGDAKEIVIEDAVWIGANCIILPGVRIGKGSVIASGSIVVKDIPEMVLAGGSPAKIIKSYQ